MRKITKLGSPPELIEWKRQNPSGRYKNISSLEKKAIRQSSIAEQKGLCAFCCCPISVESAHNAHIRSQSQYPNDSLEWDNIVASCCGKEQCGVYQGTNEIPLTPLMPECETELKFYMSGRVEGLTDRAKKTLSVLNLDAQNLRQRRKKAIDDLAYDLRFYPVEDIPTWDSELLHAFIAECDTEKDGVLPPYAPVLTNILRQFL